MSVNKKKVHPLWKGEGLQARKCHPRKRVGISSCLQLEADGPNVVGLQAFQFDQTVDGMEIKIASMIY